jgi:hypothetical protein
VFKVSLVVTLRLLPVTRYGALFHWVIFNQEALPLSLHWTSLSTTTVAASVS